MKTSLLIFLSLCGLWIIPGCKDKLPPKPDGWHCTYFYDANLPDISGMYCNQINAPSTKIFYKLDAPEIVKAQCMPLDTFERYTAYVDELKKLASKECPNIGK